MKEVSFSLTDLEEERLEEFYDKHCDCPFTSGAGGKYTFIITPTGFGPCISIRCNSCEEEKDITDWESW